MPSIQHEKGTLEELKARKRELEQWLHTHHKRSTATYPGPSRPGFENKEDSVQFRNRQNNKLIDKKWDELDRVNAAISKTSAQPPVYNDDDEPNVPPTNPPHKPNVLPPDKEVDIADSVDPYSPESISKRIHAIDIWNGIYIDGDSTTSEKLEREYKYLKEINRYVGELDQLHKRGPYNTGNDYAKSEKKARYDKEERILKKYIEYVRQRYKNKSYLTKDLPGGPSIKHTTYEKDSPWDYVGEDVLPGPHGPGDKPTPAKEVPIAAPPKFEPAPTPTSTPTPAPPVYNDDDDDEPNVPPTQPTPNPPTPNPPTPNPPIIDELPKMRPSPSPVPASKEPIVPDAINIPTNQPKPAEAIPNQFNQLDDMMGGYFDTSGYWRTMGRARNDFNQEGLLYNAQKRARTGL